MIDFERWNEIKPLVQGALDLPEEEREAYLDHACQGDQELRRQAGILLAVSATQADAYEDFVVTPPNLHAADFKEGDEIGSYRIVRPLGIGGMSTVYLADDPRHKRQVALKVLKTARRRRHEEQTVARFNHSNIVRLYDSGQIEAGPAYFVMEYVDGEEITTYCETKRLTIEERLRLFLTVCDAVAYAHRHLVVHRDLKPSNILVRRDDGVLKLLDFGIAKNLSPSFEVTATAPEDRALTVAFASPEQLSGETTSTATDIYSLGVLLCLMLTGRLPYTVKSHYELPMAIRVAEPKRPSQLVKEPPHARGANERTPQRSESETRKLERALHGDLDEIVLKTLRKEPEHRYSTVAELAADVEHYLNKEPISARKGNARYRARKFIRRHRLAVILTTSIVIASVGVSIWLLVLFREAQYQRNHAHAQQERSEAIKDFMVKSFELSNPFTPEPSNPTVRDLLDKAASEATTTLTRQPELQVAVLSLLAHIYNDLGLFDKARSLAKSALDRGLSRLPQTSPELADALFSLAMVESSASNYPKAETLFRKSLSIRRNALGETHREYADSMYSLGTTLYYQGKTKEAESLYRHALHLQRTYNPHRTIAIVKSMTGLALLLERSQRYEEAERLYREALTITRRDFGPNHPTLANILDPLAQLLTNTTRFKEAEAMHREALAITVRSVGEDHPNIILRIYNLGFLLSFQGKDAEAEQMYRQALEKSRRIYGEEHEYTLVISGNLARLLSKRKKYGEALRLVSNAQTSAEAAFGAHHSITVVLKRHKAYILFDSGNIKAADQQIREVINILNKNPDANPLEKGVSKSLLGDCLIAQDKFEEAEPLIVSWYKAAPPREIPSILKTLIDLYSRWGKPQKAAEYRKLLKEVTSRPEPATP